MQIKEKKKLRLPVMDEQSDLNQSHYLKVDWSLAHSYDFEHCSKILK